MASASAFVILDNSMFRSSSVPIYPSRSCTKFKPTSSIVGHGGFIAVFFRSGVLSYVLGKAEFLLNNQDSDGISAQDLPALFGALDSWLTTASSPSFVRMDFY